jgi:hypothetical protein
MPNTPDPTIVFVVHGRNIEARNALFIFLKAIGLHPLEWSEAITMTGEGSPYIGDVLEKAFSVAQAIIVLMTPDDEARLRLSFRSQNEETHDIELTPQARQNVLFEAGMAMGRSLDRTILVELGKVRPFSDIVGRHVIRIDNSKEKRSDLASRLKNAGCPIELSGDYWQSAGDFMGALAGGIPGVAQGDGDNIDWAKTGAIWWMCGDTIETIGRIAGGASRELIFDGLNRMHNHATQLHLGEIIINKLQNLKTEALSLTDKDWTSDKREKVALEVRRIFNSISQLAIEHQKKNHPQGFKSEPD